MLLRNISLAELQRRNNSTMRALAACVKYCLPPIKLKILLVAAVMSLGMFLVINMMTIHQGKGAYLIYT